MVVTETRTTVPALTLAGLLACPAAMEGLAKNARFPPTHQEVRGGEYVLI